MRLRYRACAYAICFGVLSATAAADDAERIIEHRIAGFRDMGAAFKSIDDELKTQKPNLTRIRDSALVVRDYGKQVPEWFPHGSEPPERPSQSWIDWIRSWFSSDSGYVAASVYDTKAKMEIWQQPTQFAQAYKQFQTEVDTLWATAQGSDVAAIRTQHRVAAKTCAHCHDTFREPID